MANAIVHDCIVCGATFRHTKPKSNKFCGAACYHEAQRRGMVKVGREAHRLYPCHQCGVIVNRGLSTRRNGETSDKAFCSRACYDASRSKTIESRAHKCKGCGQLMSGRGVFARTLYCSMACRVLSKKPSPSKCVNCGVMFSAIRPRGADGWTVLGSRKTCSPYCHNQWIRNDPERKRKIGESTQGYKHHNWQGGKSLLNSINNRGPNWQTQRSRAIKRDGNACVDCGMTGDASVIRFGRGLDVDHIVPFHNFDSYMKANRLANLECRCKSCHRKAEAKRHMVQMVLPMQDSVNRQHKGYDSERHPRAKLTWGKVADIRRMIAAGVTQTALAAKYGCSQSAIWCIKEGKTWAR